MSTPDAEPLPLDLQKSLDALLHGSVGMVHEAMSAMPPAEVQRLTEALESERTEIAVTFLYPSGALRVYVAGEWDGERVLFEMTPDRAVMELLKQ